MFVDFLCTDVSSLLPHLVMFMPTKEIVSCSAIYIVKQLKKKKTIDTMARVHET